MRHRSVVLKDALVHKKNNLRVWVYVISMIDTYLNRFTVMSAPREWNEIISQVITQPPPDWTFLQQVRGCLFVDVSCRMRQHLSARCSRKRDFLEKATVCQSVLVRCRYYCANSSIFHPCTAASISTVIIPLLRIRRNVCGHLVRCRIGYICVTLLAHLGVCCSTVAC